MSYTIEEHYTDSNGDRRKYVVATFPNPPNLTQIHQWFAANETPLTPSGVKNFIGGVGVVPTNSFSTYRMGEEE